MKKPVTLSTRITHGECSLLDERLTAKGFSSRSAYLRHLISEDLGIEVASTAGMDRAVAIAKHGRCTATTRDGSRCANSVRGFVGRPLCGLHEYFELRRQRGGS